MTYNTVIERIEFRIDRIAPMTPASASYDKKFFSASRLNPVADLMTSSAPLNMFATGADVVHPDILTFTEN